jgi:murein DD-endopeptidase MepM/ murein hydrolase activator NlpD
MGEDMRRFVVGLLVLWATVAHACPRTDSRRLMRPSDGEMNRGFGVRAHPLLEQALMHTDVDYSAVLSDAVRAAGAGAVVAAKVDGPMASKSRRPW